MSLQAYKEQQKIMGPAVQHSRLTNSASSHHQSFSCLDVSRSTAVQASVRIRAFASFICFYLFLDVLGGPTLNVSNEVVVEMGGQGGREGPGSICRSLA